MKLRYGSPEEVGMSSQRVASTIAAMREWNQREGKQAAVLLAARRGVIVAHEAIGRLRPEPDSPPVALDTIFWMASITKPVTAAAVMILVEEGMLGLNLPVSFYLPELSGEGKDAITVIHLMTHTSGLRDEEVEAYAKQAGQTAPDLPPEPTQHPDIAKHLAARWAAPLWKPPCQEMSYCSYGYVLLGEVVRRVSGRSLADFARERIFEPLGMKDTSYGVRESSIPRMIVRPDSWYAAWLASGEARAPWGRNGVMSTAMDLAIFGQLFLNGGSYGGSRILSPTTVAAMTRNQIPGISARFGTEYFPEACMSLGWFVTDGNKGVQLWRAMPSSRAIGYTGGGGSSVWVDLTYNLTVAYLPAQTSTPFASTYPDHYGFSIFQDSIIAAIEEV